MLYSGDDQRFEYLYKFVSANRVYVMLTNNANRTPDQIDPANPRAANVWGHILEVTPANGDHGAITFGWDT